MSRKLTTEEYIDKARKVHGGRYDYSKTLYVKSHEKVTITCRDHGDFQTLAHSHTNSKSGCPICGGNLMLTAEEFIERAKEVHNGKYSYENTQYVGLKTKSSITCVKHGDFEQSPGEHLRGYGCQKCKSETLSSLYTKDQDVFIEECQAVHEGKYDYSLVKYIKGKKRIDILCPLHGVFSQIAYNHSIGRGCPLCKISGYRQLLPGSLYVLKAGDIFKVGITNRAVHKRAEQISYASGKKFSVEFSINFSDGSIPLQAETRLLKDLSASYQKVKEKFDGCTECFLGVEYKTLISRVMWAVEETFKSTNQSTKE